MGGGSECSGNGFLARGVTPFSPGSKKENLLHQKKGRRRSSMKEDRRRNILFGKKRGRETTEALHIFYAAVKDSFLHPSKKKAEEGSS